MTSLRTTHSPARSVSLARAAAAGAVLLAAAAGSAHDEDWRKLVDRIGAIEGPIFRLDPETAGASNRGAGFDNQGVTLLSQIPLNQFAGTQNLGNDCWGYTSPSGREYAIMGLERGFGFVEITNPPTRSSSRRSAARRATGTMSRSSASTPTA
jgi:hypothetical protein